MRPATRAALFGGALAASLCVAGLASAGPVEGTAAPAVVWTVDAESGEVAAPPGPRGGPSAGAVRRAERRLRSRRT